MKQEYNVGWKEAISQLDDYYSPQVESLQDQILDLKRETENYGDLTTVASEDHQRQDDSEINQIIRSQPHHLASLSGGVFSP